MDRCGIGADLRSMGVAADLIQAALGDRAPTGGSWARAIRIRKFGAEPPEEWAERTRQARFFAVSWLFIGSYPSGHWRPISTRIHKIEHSFLFEGCGRPQCLSGILSRGVAIRWCRPAPSYPENDPTLLFTNAGDGAVQGCLSR